MYYMTTINTDGSLSLFLQSEPPSLEFMQKAVGGYAELIPGFNRYGTDACVAFCDEEGKFAHKKYQPNACATHLWWACVAGQGPMRPDVLMGNVLVITTDTPEEMEAL